MKIRNLFAAAVTAGLVVTGVLPQAAQTMGQEARVVRTDATTKSTTTPNPQNADISALRQIVEGAPSDAPADDAKFRIKEAAKRITDQLGDLKGKLSEAPKPVDVTRWTQVHQGAQELMSTTRKLKVLREQVLSAVQGLTDAGGTLRSRLGDLEQMFLQLADEADREVSGVTASGTDAPAPLPEPLLDAIRKEAQAHRDAAAVCRRAADAYSKVLQEHYQNIQVVARSGQLLARADRAAAGWVALAETAEGIDSARQALTLYGTQLNALIQQLDSLASVTSQAVAQISVNTSASSETTRVRPVSANR